MVHKLYGFKLFLRPYYVTKINISKLNWMCVLFWSKMDDPWDSTVGVDGTFKIGRYRVISDASK